MNSQANRIDAPMSTAGTIFTVLACVVGAFIALVVIIEVSERLSDTTSLHRKLGQTIDECRGVVRRFGATDEQAYQTCTKRSPKTAGQVWTPTPSTTRFSTN